MIINEIKIELTNKCLLNCLHCSSESDISRNAILSNLVVDNLIDQIINFKCKKVCFSGGEPLLHPDLSAFLKKLYLNRIQVKVYTSGITDLCPPIAISYERLRTLKLDGLSHLIFSLYSSESYIHDSITQINGSFNATINAIKNSIQAGIKVEVHFVALKNIINEIHPLIELVDSHGVKKVSILRFVPQGRGKLNEAKLTPTPEDYLKLRNNVIILRKKYPNIILRLGAPFNFLLIDSPKPCAAGIDQMLIDPKGFVFPCDAMKQIKLMKNNNNILLSSLSQIFDFNPLFITARKRNTPDLCKSCDFVSKCLSGCLAQRILNRPNNRLAIDPGCLRKLINPREPLLMNSEGNLSNSHGEI